MPMTSWQARQMRKLGIVLLLSVTASGCVVRANGRMNPVASLLVTGVAVAVVANAVVEASNPPPPVVDVEVFAERGGQGRLARPDHSRDTDEEVFERRHAASGFPSTGNLKRTDR